MAGLPPLKAGTSLRAGGFGSTNRAATPSEASDREASNRELERRNEELSARVLELESALAAATAEARATARATAAETGSVLVRVWASTAQRVGCAPDALHDGARLSARLVALVGRLSSGTTLNDARPPPPPHYSIPQSGRWNGSRSRASWRQRTLSREC